MNGLSEKWQIVIAWIMAYANIIAFAIAGGYLYVKATSDVVKAQIKRAFIVTAIFLAISALLSLTSTFLQSICGVYSNVFNILNALNSIARIVVFAVFIILALVKSNTTSTSEQKVEVKETTATKVD